MSDARSALLTRESLTELSKAQDSECNEFANGTCYTRGCFVRAGWTNGPTAGFTPTCDAKKIRALIDAYHAVCEENARLKKMADALRWTVQHDTEPMFRSYAEDILGEAQQ